MIVSVFENTMLHNIKYTSAIFASLMGLGEHTLIPEIYHVFGYNQMIKFLDIFAGTVFTVPSQKNLEDAIIDAIIYTKLTRKGRGSKTKDEALKSVCKEYKISKKKAIGIYKKISALKKKYQGVYHD